MKTLLIILGIVAALTIAVQFYTEYVHDHAWYFSKRFVKVVDTILVIVCVILMIVIGIFFYELSKI